MRILIILFYIFLQLFVEFLPISSGGHCELFLKLLIFFSVSLDDFFLDKNILSNIHLVLHFPSFLILIIVFFKSWFFLIFENNNYFAFLNLSFYNGCNFKRCFKALLFIFIADFITILFWSFDLRCKNLLLGFCCTFFFLMLLFFKKENKKKDLVKSDFEFNLLDAFLIGVAQSFALSAGVSRFATTFFCGNFICGYSNYNSLLISFLIALPLMFAGSLKAVFFLNKNIDFFSNSFILQILIAISFFTLIVFFLLKIIIKIVKKDALKYFAFYMFLPIFLSLFLKIKGYL